MDNYITINQFYKKYRIAHRTIMKLIRLGKLIKDVDYKEQFAMFIQIILGLFETSKKQHSTQNH